MASATINTFIECETALPSRLNNPIVKAISVAAGIAQPLVNSVLLVITVNINAGNATPNKAEITGSIILLGDEISPSIASFLISRAT